MEDGEGGEEEEDEEEEDEEEDEERRRRQRARRRREEQRRRAANNEIDDEDDNDEGDNDNENENAASAQTHRQNLYYEMLAKKLTRYALASEPRRLPIRRQAVKEQGTFASVVPLELDSAVIVLTLAFQSSTMKASIFARCFPSHRNSSVASLACPWSSGQRAKRQL